MNKGFLGIDIASVNAGYAHILLQNNKFVVKNTSLAVTPNDYKNSDVLKAYYQANLLKDFINSTYIPRAVAVEAPALGSANLAVSIGFIHGFILDTILSYKIPIVYVPPTKWKYALLGNGRADKKISQQIAVENFNLTKKPNHNVADALHLSYIAYLFYCYLNKIKPLYFKDENRLKEIFWNPKPLNKPAGIMLREKEFYFTFQNDKL